MADIRPIHLHLSPWAAYVKACELARETGDWAAPYAALRRALGKAEVDDTSAPFDTSREVRYSISVT